MVKSAERQSAIAVRVALVSDFDGIRTLLRDGDHYHRQLGLFGLRPDTQDYQSTTYDMVLADPAAAVFVATNDNCAIGFARASSVVQPGGRVHATVEMSWCTRWSSLKPPVIEAWARLYSTRLRIGSRPGPSKALNSTCLPTTRLLRLSIVAKVSSSTDCICAMI